MRTRPISLLVLPAVAVAALAACGGDGGPSTGGGVATLPPTTAPTTTTAVSTSPGPSTTSDADDTGGAAPDVDTAPSTATGDTSAPSSDPVEAMLDYAACMRDNGIDMPDPEITEDGGMMMSMVVAAGDGPGPEEYEEAHEACVHLMEAAQSNIDIDPEQQAELQEQMLEFAQCMRDHGIDMPDPQFDDNGGVSIQVGGPNDDRPTPRTDEEFAEASKECGRAGGMMPAITVEEAG